MANRDDVTRRANRRQADTASKMPVVANCKEHRQTVRSTWRTVMTTSLESKLEVLIEAEAHTT